MERKWCRFSLRVTCLSEVLFAACGLAGGKTRTTFRWPWLVLLFFTVSFTSCRTTETRESRAPAAAARAPRVDRVLTRLLPCFPKDTCRQYAIIPSAVPNASINPRGTLKLTTGLLEFAETDDLLAFALAHELSHAALRHPQRQRRNGWLQILATGAAMWAAHEAMDSKSGAALTGTGVFFSTALGGTLPAMRRMEVEADHLAKDILRRAGYRTDAAADFWRRYAKARPHRPRPVWISGHPRDADRVGYLQEAPAKP